MILLRDHVKGGALTEVTFCILLSLYTPRHGYAIMQFIEEITHGRLVLGAGTLYGALATLQKKGWIAPCKKTDERKKDYVITTAGKEAVEEDLLRLKELSCIADEILGGTYHD